MTPRQPSSKPTSSSPYTVSPLRTTARITALSPGQSPPPVSSPTRIVSRYAGRRPPCTLPRPMAPPNGIVVAIDAGTTGVRSFAIDESGQPRGWSYREFTQHFPEPGRVEHDAAEIWTVRAGDARGAPRRARPTDRRDRDHEPARDRRGVGPAHGPAVASSDRVAGPAHGAALRRAARGRPSAISCARRPVSCSIRTSPRRSSSGSCTPGSSTRAPTWPSAPSTAGCCGT